MFDSTIFDLARTQSGVITRRQLIAHERSPSQIWRACTTGHLTRLLPAVYLVAPSPGSFEARCFAVQLWLRSDSGDDGDGADADHSRGALTGRTAGRLLGLSRMGGAPIQCLVPDRRVTTTPDWVEVHRSRWYDADRHHHVLPSGLVVTNPERTLFALAAATLTQRRFDHIADDAWNLGLTTPTDMANYLDRHRCRGKDGVTLVDGWVERSLPRDRATQSYFERNLLDALDTAGLPQPITQYPLVLRSGERVHLDIAWPDVRLAVEPGHTRFHDPAADAVRDLACAEQGWMVHRLTEHTRDQLDRFARLIAASYRRRHHDLTHPDSA